MLKLAHLSQIIPMQQICSMAAPAQRQSRSGYHARKAVKIAQDLLEAVIPQNEDRHDRTRAGFELVVQLLKHGLSQKFLCANRLR